MQNGQGLPKPSPSDRKYVTIYSFCQFQEQVDITRFSLLQIQFCQEFQKSVLEPIRQGVHKPTGFMGKELTQPPGYLNDTDSFVYNNDCPCPQRRACTIQILKAHSEHRAPQTGRIGVDAPPGMTAFSLFSAGHSPSIFIDQSL